jgi:hypothetical protein
MKLSGECDGEKPLFRKTEQCLLHRLRKWGSKLQELNAGASKSRLAAGYAFGICLPSKDRSTMFRFRKLLKPSKREFLNCVPLPRRGAVLGRNRSMDRTQRPTLFPLCFPQKPLQHILDIRYSLTRRDREDSSLPRESFQACSISLFPLESGKFTTS